jgi:dihydroflavonol-4-reductase
MIVVTGATGHIGNVLVRALLARGAPVRVLLLPGEDLTPLAGMNVERVTGDVCDVASLNDGFEGADTVFHLAGIISISPGQRKLMQRVNVQGAHNIVEACLKNRIRRLVYTSSVHAFEESPHGNVICETFDIDVSLVVGDYGKSKARSTAEIVNGMKQGLDTVVVFPSGVIGPYDYKGSEMGQLILDYAGRKLPAYIDGAYDFVDVRDVADGLIGAAEKGRSGEGYLLTGEMIQVQEILSIMQGLTGIPPPSFKVPFWLARLAARFTPLHYGLTHAKPRFTSYSLHVLRSNCQFNNEKARRELGFAPRPIRQSIADSYNWFKETGRLTTP